MKALILFVSLFTLQLASAAESLKDVRIHFNEIYVQEKYEVVHYSSYFGMTLEVDKTLESIAFKTARCKAHITTQTLNVNDGDHRDSKFIKVAKIWELKDCTISNK